MDQYLQKLLNLLSEKDGVNYLDPNLSAANIPLTVIPLLKCKSKKGAVEHLLHDLINEYNPSYNHEQYDKIFTVAIDYLDVLESSEKKNNLAARINNLRDNAFNHIATNEHKPG